MPESKDILNGLCCGSKRAYDAFFKHYYQDLFLWANSIVKDSGAAEDVVQEFFISFWEKKKYKSINSNFQSYIYRAVKNACLNYLQHKKKLIYDTKHFEEQESATGANEQVLKNSQQIYSAINELPEKCKEVFMLCCVSGYTYNEAAEELGVSINTVRTHMLRAFRVLREKLKSPYLFYLLFSMKGIMASRNGLSVNSSL